MLSWLKSIFAEPTANEQSCCNPTSVLELNTEFGVSKDGKATIRRMKNGKFRLLVNQNEVAATYARKRDAIRGAARKGLTVTEA